MARGYPSRIVKAENDVGGMRCAFFAQTGHGAGSDAFAMGFIVSNTPSQCLQ
jgi:hypothetical protein